MARERFAAKPKAALEISRAFGIVADSIKRELLSLTPESYSQMKAMETKRRIDKRLTALASYSARWARRAVASSYAESSGVAITRLQMLGFKRSRHYNPDQHAQAKDKIRSKMTETFIKAIHSMRDMTARYVAALGQADVQLQQIQEFNPGFIPGEVIADIVAKTLVARKARVYAQRLLMDYLRGLVGAEKYISITGKDGIERMYRVRDYAELVAQTELHQAYQAAKKERALEYESDLMKFSQHAGACDLCKEYEGEIYSISGNHPDYPPLTPEIECPHPRCEHSLDSISEEALEW